MTKRPSDFPGALVAPLIFFLCLGIGQVSAGDPQNADRQDVWLVDSSSVRCGNGEPDVGVLRYYRLEERRWIPSDAEEFIATQDAEIPLIVYSPGYTTTRKDITEIGMKLVSLYARKAACRTVFWKWPSEKNGCRLVPDIRAKIGLAADNAKFLAAFLHGLAPDSKVCLIGFSFGNRIVLDAVEKLAAGEDGNLTLHLVLAGAATDQGSLAPGGRHASVPGFCDKILVLYNPDDAKLNFYRFLYGKQARPEALGRLGPPMNRLRPEDRSHVEAVNINRYVGSEHLTVQHIMTPSFRNRIGTYLFFE